MLLATTDALKGVSWDVFGLCMGLWMPVGLGPEVLKQWFFGGGFRSVGETQRMNQHLFGPLLLVHLREVLGLLMPKHSQTLSLSSQKAREEET